MAWSLPRLLRRLGPSSRTSSTRCRSAGAAARSSRCTTSPSSATPTAMGRLDRLAFRLVVPRAARRADHVLAVSERTKRDVVELYGVAAARR